MPISIDQVRHNQDACRLLDCVLSFSGKICLCLHEYEEVKWAPKMAEESSMTNTLVCKRFIDISLWISQHVHHNSAEITYHRKLFHNLSFFQSYFYFRHIRRMWILRIPFYSSHIVEIMPYKDQWREANRRMVVSPRFHCHTETQKDIWFWRCQS